MNKISSRIPSLDGLRAVAIALVILKHLSSGHTLPLLDYVWRFEWGDLGVRVFFVISGFLITTLLLDESERNGRIDLRAFYLRRVLRIFPAYYTLLAIIGIGAVLGVQTITARQLAAPAFYLSNYLPTVWALAHTWSLAVEEQFYLLWPGLIVLFGWRKALYTAVLFCLLAPLLRVWPAVHGQPLELGLPGFQHTGDSIAIGCLYAIWRFKTKRPLTDLPPTPIALIIFAALIALSTSQPWPLFWNGIGCTLANLLIVVLLDKAINAPAAPAFKWLNSKPVVWMGTLSYSLYLWQQVFVYGGFRLPAPWNVAAIITTACLSYYCIERPFLRLKQNVAPGPSPLAAIVSVP